MTDSSLQSKLQDILRAVKAIVAARKKTHILLMGWMQRIRLAVMYFVIKSAILKLIQTKWAVFEASPNKFGPFLGLLANPNKICHSKPMPDRIQTFWTKFCPNI
jgi:hypothetical protein